VIGFVLQAAVELTMGVELLAFATTILVVAALFGLGCIALAARAIERSARANALIQAQSDEHAKVALCFSEKIISRMTAACIPRGHSVYRSLAGSNAPTSPMPDGLQHKVVPHFSSPFPEKNFQIEEVKRRLAAEAAANMARVRAESFPMQEIPVGTPTDFEIHPEHANGAAQP